MAGSKSGPCPEIAPETASRRLEHTLSAFLAARLLPGERLCVGLSGGRDSVVLLHALDRLRARGRVGSLAAIHVDHGLSANAGTWAGFCAEFCRQLGVPLDIVHVEVPRDDGEGLEAAARRARHRVFAGCCADWLALAHHQDDQAETVLFRLLRGAGSRALPACPPSGRRPAGHA
jgi:tRNA(Ile)-lysidine synthase